jgi:hypothetical protein
MRLSIILGALGLVAGLTSAWYWWKSSRTKATSRWLLSAAFVLASVSAHAIEPKSVAYYCTTEAAGGLWYDEQLKKWRSANFRTGKGFVLKLQFLSATKEKMFESATELTAVNKFNVTVTEAGSNSDRACRNMKDYKLPISVWGDGWVRCDVSLTEYIFNPTTNRFMAAYLVGYVDGDDNNDNTPSIAGGVCTKIN